MLYALILAGGVGKRLWPVSSQKDPKQFKSLIGKETLLANTYNRMLAGLEKDQVFVVTSNNLKATVKKQFQIDQNRLIIEPMANGTALAIGYGVWQIADLDPEAVLVTVNSDQHISNVEKYHQSIQRAYDLAQKNPGHMILLGVRPSYPETGYGYIELGDSIDQNVHQVKSFKEKPNLETAQKYFESKNYLWNPAFFVFRAQDLKNWYKKYLPNVYQVLQSISAKDSFEDRVSKYESGENISIDYGLIEKLSQMMVVEAEFDWMDIGSWLSLRDIQAKSKQDNVTNTKVVNVDSQGNLLYSFSDKLIATVGVKDMILVETDKAILLCPAHRSQEVKKILKDLENKNLKEYL